MVTFQRFSIELSPAGAQGTRTSAALGRPLPTGKSHHLSGSLCLCKVKHKLCCKLANCLTMNKPVWEPGTPLSSLSSGQVSLSTHSSFLAAEYLSVNTAELTQRQWRRAVIEHVRGPEGLRRERPGTDGGRGERCVHRSWKAPDRRTIE